MGTKPHKRWPKSAAGIAGKGQKGKKSSTAVGYPCRCKTDGTRPHDAYSQTADHAAGQTQ